MHVNIHCNCCVYVWCFTNTCLVTTQSRDLKRFKDNQKEEEKLTLKRAEVSASKREKKQVVNQAKSEIIAKRQEKVG